MAMSLNIHSADIYCVVMYIDYASVNMY